MFSCPQAVRATPIPVTWMTREEDSLLSGQVGGDRGWCWRDWLYVNIRWWKLALRLREDFHFSNWPDCGSKVIRIFPILLVFYQSFFESLIFLITGEWKQISVVVTSSHLLLTRWVGHSFFWFNSSPVTPTFNFRDFFTWLFQPGKDQLEVIAAIAIPTIQGLVGVPLNSSSRTQMFWPNLLAVYLRKVAG